MKSFIFKSMKELESKLEEVMKNENISYDCIVQKLEYVFNSMKSGKDCFISIKKIPTVHNKKCTNYENSFNFKIKVVADRSSSIKIIKKDLLNEYHIEFPFIQYKYRIKYIDEASMFDYINTILEDDIDKICSFTSVRELLLKYNNKLFNNRTFEYHLISHNIKIYEDLVNNGDAIINKKSITSSDNDVAGSIKLNTTCINDLNYETMVYDMFDRIQSTINKIFERYFKIDNYSVIIFRDDIGYNKINQIVKINIKLFKDVNLNDCLL
jgi:galactitol-specific phosphotransferase system IIB component